MWQVKIIIIIFRLFYFETGFFFFSNQVNLFQLRSLCFNLDQFGAGKKTRVTGHKSQLIACQYRKYPKHSLKLTLGLNKRF